MSTRAKKRTSPSRRSRRSPSAKSTVKTFRRTPYAFEVQLAWKNPIPPRCQQALWNSTRQTLKEIPLNVLKQSLARNTPHSLCISIVSRATIQRLNHTYRGQDRPTDVLSFARLEAFQPEIPERVVGDVFVCWNVCQSQATERKIPLHEELTRLTVHGILHLFGYDHEHSESGAKRMFRLQDRIIRESLRSDRV